MDLFAFLSVAAGLANDLWTAWSPFAALVATVATVAYIAPRMIVQARANAAVRAERHARKNYRAEVIDITPFLTRPTEGNIA